MINNLAPVHPGEILRDGFLTPTGLSAHTLARVIGVPPSRIEQIASEEAPITTDTAMRLARYFGTTVQFWMGLQAQHDLEYARHLVGMDREPVRAAAA
jgi:antitoxin HigA-1